MARHLKKDMATIRRQEKETTDMTISELADWQRVLEVPLADLLVDLRRPALATGHGACSVGAGHENGRLNR